jgi:excisionase family DNA binding protein
MEITFNELPNAVTQLHVKLSNIERLLLEKSTEQKQEPERWFDLEELVTYDPEKRRKPTFYGYIHSRTIPFHKRGKKLIFLKSEIDQWLKEGRKKTLAESSAEADAYLKRKGGYNG